MGFLYASDAALARGDYPLFVDMRGASWVAADEFLVEPTAARYEDWEFSYALVLGLAAAVAYAREVGIETARRRATQLAAKLRSALETIDGVRVLERGETSSALIHAAIAGRHAQDVVAELRERGVNVGAPLWGYGSRDPRERHIESAVRFSPHYYNTDSEIDDAVAHLRDVLRHDDARVGVRHPVP